MSMCLCVSVCVCAARLKTIRFAVVTVVFRSPCIFNLGLVKTAQSLPKSTNSC